MTVIKKKNEKVAAVADGLPDSFTIEQFVEAFQKTYPKDWETLVWAHKKYERKTKPGKASPMPTPWQYLKNALNVYRASQVTRRCAVRDSKSEDLNEGFFAAMADEKA